MSNIECQSRRDLATDHSTLSSDWTRQVNVRQLNNNSITSILGKWKRRWRSPNWNVDIRIGGNNMPMLRFNKVNSNNASARVLERSPRLVTINRRIWSMNSIGLKRWSTRNSLRSLPTRNKERSIDTSPRCSPRSSDRPATTTTSIPLDRRIFTNSVRLSILSFSNASINWSLSSSSTIVRRSSRSTKRHWTKSISSSPNNSFTWETFVSNARKFANVWTSRNETFSLDVRLPNRVNWIPFSMRWSRFVRSSSPHLLSLYLFAVRRVNPSMFISICWRRNFRANAKRRRRNPKRNIFRVFINNWTTNERNWIASINNSMSAFRTTRRTNSTGKADREDRSIDRFSSDF